MPETKKHELITVDESTGTFSKVEVSGEITTLEKGYEPSFMKEVRAELEALRKEAANESSLQTKKDEPESKEFDRSFKVGKTQFQFIGKLMAFHHPETGKKVSVKDALQDQGILKLLVEGNYGIIEKAKK